MNGHVNESLSADLELEPHDFKPVFGLSCQLLLLPKLAAELSRFMYLPPSNEQPMGTGILTGDSLCLPDCGNFFLGPLQVPRQGRVKQSPTGLSFGEIAPFSPSRHTTLHGMVL